METGHHHSQVEDQGVWRVWLQRCPIIRNWGCTPINAYYATRYHEAYRPPNWHWYHSIHQAEEPSTTLSEEVKPAFDMANVQVHLTEVT